jgi:hypothetical protein
VIGALRSLLLVATLSALCPLWLSDTSASAGTVPVTLGKSLVVLDGPWRFHTGDDLSWAEPAFDDSAWETVDLTAPTGAHDADVGLTGYTPGWTARGHKGYSGYAWYRLRVSVTAGDDDNLAIAGPPSVDDAYEMFVNGHLLSRTGQFSDGTPSVYSVQPQMFRLPAWLQLESRQNGGTLLVAMRVWMGPWSLASPDAGGIHIAPALGESASIDARYRLQWLETVNGYIVEVVEALLFVLLAVMACSLAPFNRPDLAYGWLAAAFVLTAAYRANQALYFWGQFETYQGFELFIAVLVYPLSIGAWVLAWRSWFRLREPGWILNAVVALTLAYILAQLFSRSWFYGVFPHAVDSGLHLVITGVRLLLLLMLVFIVYRGTRQQGREGWITLPAVLLISVALFAQELSLLHVPGIWFPFGTGVSRTQFAYAGFDIVMFGLLLRRLLQFALAHRDKLV